MCPCTPAHQLPTRGCLSSGGLCLLLLRQGFLFQGMERNAQAAQEWDEVWEQNEEWSGERSPCCAKSLSAVWGPYVQYDCLPA